MVASSAERPTGSGFLALTAAIRMADSVSMTSPTAEPRPVVVGVDGSPSSYAAAGYAAWLAETRDAPLHLLHGYFTPSYGYAIMGIADPYELTSEQAIAEGDQLLAELAQKLKLAHPGLRSIRATQVGSSPAPLLIEQSKTAQLTGVGCRGLGGFSELLLGSVSAQVAAHAHGPVIVVRPPGNLTAPTTPVLAGYDGSPSSQLALEFAASEALRRKAKLVVVHVFADDPAAAEDLLVDAVRPLSAAHPDLDVELRTVFGLQPDQVLASESRDAGLLVLGCRGRGGFAGVLLGSVSRTLVHHASCPVAVVHRDGSEHE